MCGHKVNIDYTKSINEQELLQETRVVLSLIYRDYICSPEKRNTLIQVDKEELARIENELREKYNPDNLFKNRKRTEDMNSPEENAIIEVKKENIFKRILNKIKAIFHLK